MKVYSIIIEAYDVDGLAFFQNFHVAATDVRHAIDLLFADKRLEEVVQIDVDELHRIEDTTDNNIHVVEASGRSYYDTEN